MQHLWAPFALLFALSGFLLWYGERNTDFRWTSTLLLHPGLTIASVFPLTGHLYLTLIHPATRHSLRGMTLGSVRQDWAHGHHAKWLSREESAPTSGPAPPDAPPRAGKR